MFHAIANEIFQMAEAFSGLHRSSIRVPVVHNCFYSMSTQILFGPLVCKISFTILDRCVKNIYAGLWLGFFISVEVSFGEPHIYILTSNLLTCFLFMLNVCVCVFVYTPRLSYHEFAKI